MKTVIVRTMTLKTPIGVLCALLCCCPVQAKDALQPLQDQLGASPALVVVVSSGNALDQATIATLIKQTPWTVICEVPDERGQGIRELARKESLLGGRVTVIDSAGNSLWLASDMADAVWVLPGVANPPSPEEIERVLHAGGIAVTPGNTTIKPAQPGTDQWRHPYHGPDNNVVSRDKVARLPGELRFQTDPVFAAMPNQSLFAGGRVFFFTGHIAFHEREEPLLNKLTVLNAYNGLTLWSRPLDPRFVVHNFTKVATDRHVIYAEGGSLLVLDAATGKLQSKYDVPAEAVAAGDTDWKWIAQKDGMLWAAFGPPDGRVTPHRQKRQMGHWPWNVANTHYRTIIQNFGVAHSLAAFQYPDMKLKWSVTEPEAFDIRAMCMQGGRILQLAPEKYIAARDTTTGKQLWRHTPETSSGALRAIGHALKRQGWGLGWATFCCARASSGVICIAGPPFKKSVCIDFKTGKLLWSSDNESPHPFFLDDGLYVMPRVAAPTAVCRRVEPRTGKVLDEFNLGVIGSCTRLTVTPTQFFYRPGGGVGGTVYFDISARALAHYTGVVRPGCFDGAVPAFGRLYWMPLACDCWQVHGTFSMAPRVPLHATSAAPAAHWLAPASTTAATDHDWPMFRANATGSATVPVKVPRKATALWRQQLDCTELTAPICAAQRVYIGSGDGAVECLDLRDGKPVWTTWSQAAVVQPPAYWNGRVVFGSCDGILYAVDAASGQRLGTTRVAPENRLVNIMNRFMSAWPLGGGVVIGTGPTDDGQTANNAVAYTAAGSTAADGSIVAAIDLTTGQFRWRQAYTLDQTKESPLSFGVQSNLLLRAGRLVINGGAPVGIVTLDANSGLDPQGVAQLEAGQEMFIEPDGKPFCAGPELYSNQSTRTTIFKRHQGRAYFQAGGRQIALVAGRLFCANDTQTLDAIVGKMNSDPKAGGDRVTSTPWDVMKVPAPDSVLWATPTADIRGLAVGVDGLIVLHEKSVEAIDLDGNRLWHIETAASPVRWGIALTEGHCIVTLTDGQVVALAE